MSTTTEPTWRTADQWLTVGAELGEGPFWDGRTGDLGFVDIAAGRLFRTDGSQLTTVCEIDRPLGAALPSVRDGEYLLAAREGFLLRRGSGEIQTLLEVLGNRPDLRFNDAKCDPAGRVVAGTLSLTEEPAAAALLVLDDGPAMRELLAPVGLSNGLGWSPDGGTLYFADTVAGTVTRFGYDPGTATLRGGEVIVTVSGPDGLCIDETGAVWLALWDGGRVHRYTPDGRLDLVVELPVPHATSCAFFGDLLVITTARATRPDGSACAPLAGDLFAIDVGVSAPPAQLWNPVTSR
ncbi:SMP-30/gluconolactonase/LRE family protein [Nakamurella lactea]|uniref:SMP-30/gluconolactonase/LRE family protein n=1 Tax=Nakamurella lactea TaxID=459515 RepID=UPI0004110B9E|nr:SMP-30/gluconolactonase/LRE family protein [Nakamurella lactea]